MRIAYLGQMADVATENGISKKIRSQTAHWLQGGHEVRYFSLAPTQQVWSGLAALHPELLVRGHIGSRIARSYRLTNRIRAWRPNVIYFRYAYHSAGFPSLFRDVPTIAEINSDDLAEYPFTLSRAKLAYHRFTRRRVLRAAAGFVAVTPELASRFAAFGRPTEVIANGVDLDSFPIARAVEAPNLRLIFIGNPGSPWQGLERMRELAMLFPDAHIDIVGWSASEWQARAGSASAMPANIQFHGMQPREHYQPLLAQGTAAIASLALFKNGMEEACPLKVREYLANGLPVIAAFRDPDVPEGADYFLRLPNNSAPLAAHRDAIAGWLAHWRGRRVPRSAVAHLDNGVKERCRLAFLTRFVQ